MNSPRPLSPRKTGGIRFVTFSQKSVFSSLANDLREAQQQAADWMNGQPELDLITINSCLTDTTATVTVWYRVKVA